MLIASLSACLARRAFRETILVTDELGAMIANSLGWKFVCGVSSQMTEFKPRTTHIWALGKLFALSLQTVPSVHVDLDVLLLKPLPPGLADSRLIAQSPDSIRYYISEPIRRAIEIAGYPEAAPYNAGLVGGADSALVRAYAWSCLEMADRFFGSQINGTATSMVIEQYGLGVFSDRVGEPVETLLSESFPSQEEIKRCGYIHLVGYSKRDPWMIARAEARMARDFPCDYAAFLKGWEDIKDLVPAENYHESQPFNYY